MSPPPPSFMWPHKLKLAFLALPNRQVPQALPFLQCKKAPDFGTYLPQSSSHKPWKCQDDLQNHLDAVDSILTHFQQPSSLPLPWNGNYFKAVSLTQCSLLPGPVCPRYLDTDSCGLFLQDFCPSPKLSILGTRHVHTGVHTFHRPGSLYSTHFCLSLQGIKFQSSIREKKPLEWSG